MKLDRGAVPPSPAPYLYKKCSLPIQGSTNRVERRPSQASALFIKETMFSIKVEITTAAWIKNPKRRWQAGLEKAGLNWRQNLQRSHYGSTGSSFSTYARTGTLANKANYTFPRGEGTQVNLMATHYLRFLLEGTGLFGPKHAMIRPGNVMAWNNTGNVSLLNPNMSMRAAGHGSKNVNTMIFSRTSKGSIWAGKKEELVKQVVKGFAEGIREYKE